MSLNISEVPYKRKLSLVLEALAVMTAVMTPLLFVIGHFSAYFYFSSFDIPYLKYTDLYTAFSFALESIEIVVDIILIGVISVIWYFTQSTYEIRDGQVVNGAKDQKTKLEYEPYVFGVLIIFLIYSAVKMVNSDTLKQNIKNKHYIPYEISFNQGNQILKCVTSIGTIAQFQVFITQESQPVLVQENSLVYIKQLFSPLPLMELPRGVSPVKNQNYDKEMEEWLRHWKSVCPPAGQSNYKSFEFTKHFTKEYVEKLSKH